MKKLLLSLAASASVIIPTVAQLNGDGYYRVVNAVTDRYIYITDNKGKVNTATTSVDAMAIQLWTGRDRAVSDAATVLYFKKSSGNDYDITSQGTGIYQIIGRYLTVLKSGDTYYAYGRESGMVKYLGDAVEAGADEGFISTETTGDRRKWYIKPIAADGDNYFAPKPTVTAGGKHYVPAYYSFPFSASSKGVRTYVIAQCDNGMAVAEEVTGTVPAETPCYIECPSTSPDGNRVTVGGSASAVRANFLGGVYFENYMNTHLNLTPYDKNTMRVLGTLADGSLGFVTASIENLPANESYLKVPAGSPASIRVVTRAEYDAAVKNLPQSVTLSQTAAKMYVGRTLQLTATIAPADPSDKSLVWSTSNASVATVSQTGLVTAVAKGTAVVTVKTINGKVATCTVTVNPQYPESINLSSSSLKVYAGDAAKLSASIVPADVEFASLTWTSSNSGIVTVTSDGTVTAIAAGEANVIVKAANGISSTCKVTVAPKYPSSVSLNRSAINIYTHESQTIVATLTPADVKDKSLTWTSADNSIATVDATGKVTGVSRGNTTVTAVSPGGAKATCTVNVARALPSSVSVNLTDIVIEVGDAVSLSATVSPSDAVSLVRWKSTDESVIKVTNSGQLTAVGVGTASAIVTTENDLAAACSVKVLAKGVPATSVVFTPSDMSLMEGESSSFSVSVEPANVSNRFVMWTSGNENVATVDQRGRVTAKTAGTCFIYAQCGQVKERATVRVRAAIAVESVTLSQSAVEAKVGDAFTLTATVAPSNATNKQLAWSSSDESVATVGTDGRVRVLGYGIAAIRATATDGSGVSAECIVTVNSPVLVSRIELDRTQYSVEEGGYFTLTATVYPENADNKSLAWRSSNVNVATVDVGGNVRVLDQGSAVITVYALDGSGVTATCAVQGLAESALVLVQGETVPVYTLEGVLLHSAADAETIRALEPGFYIIGTRKLFVK